MIGYGNYGIGGGSSLSSLSSSNLSPLAPPFTVDRSLPKSIANPVMDYSEPSINNPSLNSSIHNWVNNPPPPNSFPEFDPTHSYSNTYEFSSSQQLNLPAIRVPSSRNPYALNDGFSYSESSDGKANSFLEAKPYYPYVSSTMKPGYDVLPSPNGVSFKLSSKDEYGGGLKQTGSWGGNGNGNGMWDGFPGKEQVNQFECGGGVGSKGMTAAASSLYGEDVDLGAFDFQGVNKCEDTWRNDELFTTREMHNKPASNGQLEYKSFLETTPNFMPADYTQTSSMWKSTSVFPESYSLEPPQKAIDLLKNHFPLKGSYEKRIEQHSATPNENVSLMKTIPGNIMASPLTGTCSAFSSLAPVKFANGDNNDHNLKEHNLFPCFSSNVHFDPSQLDFHLEGNNRGISNDMAGIDLPSNEVFSKGPLDGFFEATSNLHNSHNGADNFSLALDHEKSTFPPDNSSDILDYCNPPVDSPCWKGASLSRYTPFETSAYAPSQCKKELEGCDRFNLPGHNFFPIYTNGTVNTSSHKVGEDSISLGNLHGDYGSATSPIRDSADNFAFRECGSDDAMKVGFNNMKSSCSRATLFPGIAADPKEMELLSISSTTDSNSKPSQILQQSLEKKCTSKSAVSDAEMNSNAATCNASSHGTFHATNGSSSLSSSIEDVPSMVAESHHGVSPPKLNVRTVIYTMAHLSKLLLCHHQSESCDLREQETKTLKNVISNLDKCISKINEHLTPEEEALSAQRSTSQSFAEFNIIENANMASPKVSKSATTGCLDQSSDEPSHNENKRYLVSGDVEGVKDDKMTQAIKNVLVENFPNEEEHSQAVLYKNLWLEAEAALCSITYMARFNRMKNEMDKGKLHAPKDVESPPPAKFSPATPVGEKSEPVAPDFPIRDSSSPSGSDHVNDVMARYNILLSRIDHLKPIDSVESENLESTKASAEPDMDDTSKPLPDDGHGSGIPNQIGSVDSHGNDVMDRFHILKSRIEKPNARDSVNTESLLCSDVDESSIEMKHSLLPGISIHDSPVTSNVYSNDVEDSVLDRLHIINSRAHSLKTDHALPVSGAHSHNIKASEAVERFNAANFCIKISKLVSTKQQQQPEIPDLGFGLEKMNAPTTKNSRDDETSDSIEQNDASNKGVRDDLTVNEFYLQVKDDPVVQSSRDNVQGSQFSTVLHDNSSSDWEHVLKEELSSQ